MKKLLIQRAIYNENSDIELFKILDQVNEKDMFKERGGCTAGMVQANIRLIDLIAHQAYAGIYIYKIIAHKGVKATFDDELMNFEVQSMNALPTDNYNYLKELVLKLDEAIKLMMETIDMDSYESEDFTNPDLGDFTSQTAAGWIEHLLNHQVHHRGQMSQITSEIGLGQDVSQFRLFGYQK